VTDLVISKIWRRKKWFIPTCSLQRGTSYGGEGNNYFMDIIISIKEIFNNDFMDGRVEDISRRPSFFLIECHIFYYIVW